MKVSTTHRRTFVLQYHSTARHIFWHSDMGSRNLRAMNILFRSQNVLYVNEGALRFLIFSRPVMSLQPRKPFINWAPNAHSSDLLPMQKKVSFKIAKFSNYSRKPNGKVYIELCKEIQPVAEEESSKKNGSIERNIVSFVEVKYQFSFLDSVGRKNVWTFLISSFLLN